MTSRSVMSAWSYVDPSLSPNQGRVQSLESLCPLVAFLYVIPKGNGVPCQPKAVAFSVDLGARWRCKCETS